ncbi:MAG: GNAT family N-acetyltransferase [Eubacteriales bacterium]|nr:GNAT family N-acetyltransferase [Eubacteriales bacterium]
MTPKIKSYPPAARTDALVDALTVLWEASVRETHGFLTENDIVSLRAYVPQALRAVPCLAVLHEDGKPLGFLGVDGQRLEMLFLHPREIGRGFGRLLAEYAFSQYGVNAVCVNEQNPRAAAFYRRLGFVLDRRTEQDEQGRPFPLLYLKKR